MTTPAPSRGPAAPNAASPLSLMRWDVEAPAAYANARCIAFEFSSRGDRVPGRVLLPKGTGPSPVVVLVHGAGGSMDSPYMEVAARWVDSGLAVASIDLPLHGRRRSPKFSERLLAILAGSNREGAGLLEEFARQSLADLTGCLDALTSLPELDAGRVAYTGFSLGALLGARFCAGDPRPVAAVLALAGSLPIAPDDPLRGAASDLDPAAHIAGLAPRPLLMVNVEQDARVPRRAAEALFAAAAEPKSIAWFDGTHDAIPGVGLRAMLDFLRAQLDVRP